MGFSRCPHAVLIETSQGRRQRFMKRPGFCGGSLTRENGAMSKSNKFSPEVRERAVRMVFDAKDQYESQWAAIVSIAAKIGCTAETLRRWIRQQERNAGQSDGSAGAEAARVKALEREVRELKKANEILRLASAFFAQAELDRRFKS